MFGIFKRKKTKRFGEIAVEKGLVSEKELNNALDAQKEYAEKHKIHKVIGAILTEKNVLTPADVKTILEEQKGTEGIMAWFYMLFGLSR
jgi:transcriptional regulator of NAD metabolism